MSLWKRLFGGGQKSTPPVSPVKPQPKASSQSGHSARQTNPALDQQIILAVEKRQLDEIKSLIAAGANVNVAKSQEAFNHKTFATTTCSRPLIHLALDDFGSSKEERAAVQPILEILLAAGANIDARDERNDNWTPVMRAAFSTRPMLVKYLIGKGANTKLKDANGRTVFGFIDAKNDWNYNEVKTILVESTEDGKAWLDSTAGKGWRQANAVDDKAPIPVIRADTSRVLQAALATEDSEPLKQIIRWVENGGDLEWRATNGWTLLHLAAQCGNEKMIRFLLAHGAKLEARDEDEGTPLMLACTVGFMATKLNASVVALLLDSGANPNAKGSGGSTALGLVRQSNLDEAQKIAQLLITRGATPTPGKDSPCPECGAPYSADMAKRGVEVTFNGAFAKFACLTCNTQQRVEVGQIDKAKGIQVLCKCGAIALIPASVWCKSCTQGLSTNWQSTLGKIR